MKQARKTVIVLVGPKGAGKSTIGQFLATELGIHFLRVEPLFIALRDQIGASHSDFEERGFEAVFGCVVHALAHHSVVCFESTGASQAFPGLLARLRATARVIAVKVHASSGQCLDRIKTRDLSIHIPVSDDRAQQVNIAAELVTLQWAAEIDNSGAFDPVAITYAFRQVLAREAQRDV